MFKKTLASALLVCTVPAMASGAWFLTTKVTSVGGNLSYNYNGVTAFQTYTSGAKTKSLDANGNASVSVAADAHNTIKSVTVTQVDKDGNQTVNTTAGTSVSFTPADGDNVTVWANFQVDALTATASMTNGAVSPSAIGNLYYGYQVMSDLTFNFTPKVGYTLGAIQGATAGQYVVINNATKADQRASVTFKKGYVFTGPIALTATATPPANLPSLTTSAPQNVAAGQSISLAATAANVGTVAWYYVSGPANDVKYSTVNGKVITTVTPAPAVAGFTAASTNQTGVSADKNGVTGVVQNVLGGPTGASVNVAFDATAAAGQYKFLAQASDSNGKVYSSIATVNVLAKSQDVGNQCQFCHTANGVAQGKDIGALYAASIHGNSTHSTCAACHFGNTAAGHPGSVTTATINTSTFAVQADGVVGPKGTTLANGSVFCSGCHYAIPHSTNLNAGVKCGTCHTSDTGVGGTGEAHSIKGLSCQGCHSVAQTNVFADKTLVSDNNSGVRAVTDEFKKWSHHIVNAPGKEIADEQCAVCHLEGTVGQYGFGVDGTKHMTDNKIHLRNAQTDADLQWDPAAPNHSTMDTFCMSCHSAAGATSTMNGKLQTALQALGYNASAGNPFGDTISNRYDKMMRPRVTNVDDQFNTTNNSHHGVKGPRYNGRTRTAGPRSVDSVAFAANSSATLQGIRSTIYDAGAFNALYTPLENAGGEAAPRTGAQSLGDDSTLHCGDCHTVGQWKPGTAQSFKVDAAGNTTVDTTKTSPVIGAHGSNNEYMLRNSLGTDERHVGVAYTSAGNIVTVKNAGAAYLVCYNCHAYKTYGSIFVGSGIDGGGDGTELGNKQAHAGEYANQNRCNGPGNTLPFNGFTSGKATDGTQFEQRFVAGMAGEPTLTAADVTAGYQAPKGMGNVYGIQCLNCHNSGYGNAYGGIHGSANNTNTTDATVDASVLGGAYIDGMGKTTKVERFLPGLGNAMFVPGTLGGYTGNVTNDTNWEQKHGAQTASSVFTYTQAAVQNGTAVVGTASAGAGCYTIGPAATAATSKLQGPSVTGPNGPATPTMDTWGGCDDHNAAAGAGTAFFKKIVRPVTY